MPAQPLSLSQRFSAFLARGIVRLWPAETREWGLAFEAELPEITTPLASVRWVLGGAVLLAKESLRSFMKSLRRPLGVPASDVSSLSNASGPTPRLPRVLAGIFLLASLAILCLPEVRATLGSSVLFGRTRVHEYFQERHIQRLREIVLALSFALLLFAYHPYAHPFQNAATRDEIIAAARVSNTLPRTPGLFIYHLFYAGQGRYYFWAELTVVLSLVALLLVYRIVPNRKNS